MEVKYIEGEYKAIGEFDFGFGGKFKNDENGKGNIKIRLDETDYEFLKLDPNDHDAVCKKLSKKIAYFQKVVKRKNKRLKNDYVLQTFGEGLLYSEKRFWKKCITIPEYNDKNNRPAIDKAVNDSLKANEAKIDKLTEIYRNLYDYPLKTFPFLINVEKNFRKSFKFFDFNLYFKSVYPKEIIFDAETFGVTLGNKIADEFIDEYGVRFDRKLEATYWW